MGIQVSGVGCKIFRSVGFKVFGFVVLESTKKTGPPHGFEHVKGYAELVVGKLKVTREKVLSIYLYVYIYNILYIYIYYNTLYI